MPSARIPTFQTVDLAAATAALGRQDPTMGKLIAHVGPFGYRVPSGETPYERLFRTVIYQQLAGAAARTIYGRVLAIHGGRRPPSPEQVAETRDDAFRAAGLSRNKLAAIRDLARRTLDGTVPTSAEARRSSDEALIERLTTVRGIGRWSGEMFLIFGLGRLDVLPVSDLGIRKGYAITYRSRELPPPARILRRGQRWRPWRSLASWYLYRAVEVEREKGGKGGGGRGGKGGKDGREKR